jgi:NADPH:quinone reductase
MKAVLCKKLGSADDLVVEDIPSPEPGSGQVVVQVKAAGLNFPDVLLVQGKYQFKPELPFSPGGEIAGEIIALGPKVTGWKVGDRVVAASLWGGFREQMVVDAPRLIPLPDAISWEVGASFMMVYGTTLYALRQRGQLQAGETLLVLGAAGGVGLAAVQLGKLMGAKVIAAASSAEKLALCKEQGADEVINYQTEDLKQRVKQLTNGNGADVIYDPVGGSYSESALRAINWSGRYLVIGFAAGDIPKIPLNLTLLKSCQIVGVFWGASTMREPELHAANLKDLLTWISEGKIKPHISHRWPLSKAAEAINAMNSRNVLGKIVLVPGE